MKTTWLLAADPDHRAIPIREENLEAWLEPEPKNLSASYTILDAPPIRTTGTSWRRRPSTDPGEKRAAAEPVATLLPHTASASCIKVREELSNPSTKAVRGLG